MMLHGTHRRPGLRSRLSLAAVALCASVLAPAPTANSVRAGEVSSAWQGASFPVERFEAYTSAFGPRGSMGYHYGLDIAAPQGSYIRNWWDGKVIRVINDGRCGVGLIVQSGGWEHIYCHMMGQVVVKNGRKYLYDRQGNLSIGEGQDVDGGQRIGRVGMSGRTTGPHLHWGMRYGQGWVDPATVLRAMYAESQANAQKKR